MKYAIAAALLLLTSCTPGRETYIANQQTCTQMGQTGDRLIPCMNMLFQQQNAAADDRRRRFANAAMIMNMSQPQTPAMRTTNCRPFGNQITCTTF